MKNLTKARMLCCVALYRETFECSLQFAPQTFIWFLPANNRYYVGDYDMCCSDDIM